MGRRRAGNVAFSAGCPAVFPMVRYNSAIARDVTPLLGVTALGSVGIEVDPHNETLKKLSSIHLRGYRPRFR